MFKLSKAFRAWIDYKMLTDPFWQQNARVVFSGPDVPGEGEHKVLYCQGRIGSLLLFAVVAFVLLLACLV